MPFWSHCSIETLRANTRDQAAHLDDRVGVLHDPGDQQAAAGQVQDHQVGDPVVACPYMREPQTLHVSCYRGRSGEISQLPPSVRNHVWSAGMAFALLHTSPARTLTQVIDGEAHCIAQESPAVQLHVLPVQGVRIALQCPLSVNSCER